MFSLHLQKKLQLPKDEYFKTLGSLGFSRCFLPVQDFDVLEKFSTKCTVMGVIT